MLTNADPRLAIIKAIIQSADGIKRMVLATSKGHPALSGVDECLGAATGSDYISDGAVRAEAGFRVAQEMKEMGFIEVRVDDMPHGSAAHKAKVFQFPPI